MFDEFERVEIPLPVLELLHINLRRAYNEGTVKIQRHVMISIFRDIANGLNCLHSHYKPIVVHRNVILSTSSIQLEPQPGNLWRAKLSDFGSENFLKGARMFREGEIVYTAPEMFPQEGSNAPMPSPTTKCDVFSYGIVVVEVITKTMPTIEN